MLQLGYALSGCDDEGECDDEVYDDEVPPEGDISWNPEGGGEGELVVTVPPIPEEGVAATKLVARGTKQSASRNVARQASAILNSRLAQAVMPPQARLALSAAKGLAKIIPSQWKKAGIKAGKAVAKKAFKKLKFW